MEHVIVIGTVLLWWTVLRKRERGASSSSPPTFIINRPLTFNWCNWRLTIGVASKKKEEGGDRSKLKDVVVWSVSYHREIRRLLQVDYLMRGRASTFLYRRRQLCYVDRLASVIVGMEMGWDWSLVWSHLKPWYDSRRRDWMGRPCCGRRWYGCRWREWIGRAIIYCCGIMADYGLWDSMESCAWLLLLFVVLGCLLCLRSFLLLLLYCLMYRTYLLHLSCCLLCRHRWFHDFLTRHQPTTGFISFQRIEQI